MKLNATWRRQRPGEDPVYAHASPPIHRLHGGEPFLSPPDQMHTWHHGIGRDCMASMIASRMHGIGRAWHAWVLLACMGMSWHT